MKYETLWKHFTFPNPTHETAYSILWEPGGPGANRMNSENQGVKVTNVDREGLGQQDSQLVDRKLMPLS